MSDSTTKRCSKCGLDLPATPEYFWADKSKPDGFCTRCKTCRVEDVKRTRHIRALEKQTPEGMKLCRVCLEAKPAIDDYWYPDNRRNTYRNQCKSCTDKANQQWELDNAERNKMQRSAYSYRKYWENPEAANARHKAWRESNLEYSRQRVRDYYAANKDRERARHRRWRNGTSEAYREKRRQLIYAIRKQNPHSTKIYSVKRAARKRQLPDTFTKEQAQYALNYFAGCCAVCGRQLRDLFNDRRIAFDHWIPLNHPSCPGTVATNMLPLCHGLDGCNNKKRDVLPEQWLTDVYGKSRAKKILARIQAYFDHL